MRWTPPWSPRSSMRAMMAKHQPLRPALLLLVVATLVATSAAQRPQTTTPQCTLELPQGNTGANNKCSEDVAKGELGGLSGKTFQVDIKTSGVIDIQGGSGDSVESIVIQGRNPPPQLQWTGDPFKNYTKLFALTFNSCNFVDRNVTLVVSKKLNYLHLENTNAEDLSFGQDGTPWEKLNISITGGQLKRLPRLFYERTFNAITIQNLKFEENAKPQQLTEVEFENAGHNLNATSELNVVIEKDCNKQQPGKLLVCQSSTPVSKPTKSAVEPDDTPAPAAPKDAPSTSTTTRSSGSSSSTTLIVLVVLASIVAAALLGFVARRHVKPAKRCPSPSPNADGVEYVMCDDDDAALRRTESFISSDPTLRAFRIEPSEVTLTKSIGAGPFWLGQYAGAKVFINRVEAVNHDSHTTKALRAHAQSLTTIQHSNIVSMMGVTWIDGTDFGVVAEFMAKGSLKSVLTDNHTTLDQLARVTMCLEVANALAYLHSPACDKYMRRLSSRKVLVSDTLHCKLNLFECVPVTTPLHAPQVVGAGELAWFAPEVVMESSRSDVRLANIFSLGVLLCEVLTNTTPYEAEIDELGFVQADLQLLKRIKTKQPLVPHENHPVYLGLSSDLRHLIERCLSYTLSDRPSALEVVDSLERCKATLESRAFL